MVQDRLTTSSVEVWHATKLMARVWRQPVGVNFLFGLVLAATRIKHTARESDRGSGLSAMRQTKPRDSTASQHKESEGVTHGAAQGKD